VKELKIGIMGFGTVGAGVASCLLKNSDVIARRSGIMPVLAKIADLDIERDRGIKLNKGVLTTDVHQLIKDVDVVVELIGGTTVAKDLIIEALNAGKPVVTANKALLAEKGEEIFAAAEKSKADIYYEASVAGGIPIIKSLREGFVGNRINRIYGILNGTCNYILTRMEREKENFGTVLKDAQRMGYAEANPALDIDGIDTAHKAAILASLAYGEWFGMDPIYVEGIREISLADIRYVDELGYRIKLLSIIKQETNEDVQIRVHPTLVPKRSLIAGINDVFNGVAVSGDYVGDTLFYGRGAGRDATASAVVADLLDVGLNLKFGSHRRVPAFRIGPQFRKLIPMESIKSRYYLRIQVLDKPGTLGKIANILGSHDISISSVMQREGQSKNNVALIILTHQAVEGQARAAFREIEALPETKEKMNTIRIEDI
jgi:homoserine dehydrogenase